jgi:hypothetical protein
MFEKIFYINQNNKTDIVDQIKKIEMTYITEKIELVDMDTINQFDLSKLVYGPIDNIRYVATCYWIFNKIYKENLGSVMLIDDDVEISDKFKSTMYYISTQVPKEYDMLLLGYDTNTILTTPINKDITKVNKLSGLYGFVITSKGAKKLIENAYPFAWTLENGINNKINEFNIYAINPDSKIIYSNKVNKHISNKSPDDINDMMHYATNMMNQSNGFNMLNKDNKKNPTICLLVVCLFICGLFIFFQYLGPYMQYFF